MVMRKVVVTVAVIAASGLVGLPAAWGAGRWQSGVQEEVSTICFLDGNTMDNMRPRATGSLRRPKSGATKSLAMLVSKTIGMAVNKAR
jgi:hypothetical protein